MSLPHEKADDLTLSVAKAFVNLLLSAINQYHAIQSGIAAAKPGDGSTAKKYLDYTLKDKFPRSDVRFIMNVAVSIIRFKVDRPDVFAENTVMNSIVRRIDFSQDGLDVHALIENLKEPARLFAEQGGAFFDRPENRLAPAPVRDMG